jgi:hypothetical protein
VTPDELDRLAVVQAEIRAIYAAARTHIMGWEPAPFSPPASRRQAAATVSAGGELSAPGGRRAVGVLPAPAAATTRDGVGS